MEPDPMEAIEAGGSTAFDNLIQQHVPFFSRMTEPDQERLREIATDMHGRGMAPAFIASSLRATAEVLQEMRDEEQRGDNVFQREQVRQFVESNAVPSGSLSPRHSPRRERKREERDRLQAATSELIREARLARGRHEVKKTRNMLLKVDQRELRRVLGREGDELCRQINTWLRSTASMF